MNETISDIDRRRMAVSELGTALRAVTVAACANETPIEHLAEAARLAEHLGELLSGSERPLSQGASVDDVASGIRYFNPVIGVGNPMSPPIRFDRVAERTVAVTTLDRRFEGPPGFVHGGMTALLLDELLGQAAHVDGRWGMTAFLNATYRAAVPIGVPLRLTSWITSIDGRKTFVMGEIALVSDPDHAHVTAESLFVAPKPETHERYFGTARSFDGETVELPRH